MCSVDHLPIVFIAILQSCILHPIRAFPSRPLLTQRNSEYRAFTLVSNLFTLNFKYRSFQVAYAGNGVPPGQVLVCQQVLFRRLLVDMLACTKENIVINKPNLKNPDGSTLDSNAEPLLNPSLSGLKNQEPQHQESKDDPDSSGVSTHVRL
jgi:hypothetical protein